MPFVPLSQVKETTGTPGFQPLPGQPTNLTPTPKQTGILSRLGEGAKAVYKDVQEGMDTLSKIDTTTAKSQSRFSTGLQTTGALLGTAGKVIGEGFMTAGSVGLKAVTTQEQEAKIREGAKAKVTEAAESDPG